MTTTLKLQIETIDGLGTKTMPFPGSGDEQACLSDYKYSATRMSSAPNITATLKWHRCLDEEWDTSVFVEYNGEKYFVKNTPSSSYNNTSCLYSHSLEFVSERAILDSVYFVDISTKKSDGNGNSQGDALSDNSEFSFSGDIHEFVDRLNKSLIKSGVGGALGYQAVVDDGVYSEAKLFEISNQYVTDVLKSAYELYEVPYYFVGKIIHFGNQQYDIHTPLEYGSNKSLLSISKSNSNKRVITKITGTGSERNIPYYYPNPTPKGKIYLESNRADKYYISDMLKFSSNVNLNEEIKYSYGKISSNMVVSICEDDDNCGLMPDTGFLIPANTPSKKNTIKISFNTSQEGIVVINISSGRVDGMSVSQPVSMWCDDAYVQTNSGNRVARIKFSSVDCGTLPAGRHSLILHTNFSNTTNRDYNIVIKAEAAESGTWIYSSDGTYINFNNTGISISNGNYENGDYVIQRQEWRIDVANKLMPSEYRRTRGDNRWYIATNAVDRGEYYGDISFATEFNSAHPSEYIHSFEDIFPTIKEITNASGQRIDSFLDIAFDKNDNNEIHPEGHEKAGEYVHPYFFAKLKKTDGDHGFNLFNHAIENEEMKVSFTTGHVAGCEFVIGVDDETNKNLVQVDDDGKLIRDNNGNVLCGRWGQERPTPQQKQQNTENNEVWIALRKDDSTMGILMPDATSNLIPLGDLNAAGDPREGGGDLFVILGINLPESYITAAEDRLERKVVEYLRDNNSEKFSFSLNLSSIFLAENPEIASEINENCRVRIIYGGATYTMYATSCSITVKDGLALPEVTVNIDDELKVVRPKVKDVSSVIDSTKDKIEVVKKSIRDANVSIKTLSANSNDIANQVNTLIGDDVWMSAREIAENVVAKNGGGISSTITIISSNEKYLSVAESTEGTFTITPKVLSIDDHGTSQDGSLNFGLATAEDVFAYLKARLSVKIQQ